jgi:hypothetical protein
MGLSRFLHFAVDLAAALGKVLYASRKNGGNLENAARWCETEHRLEAYATLAFRTIERSS